MKTKTNKQAIRDSLRNEAWGFSYRSGLIFERRVLAHPNDPEITVGRFGGVFVSGMRRSWPNPCLMRAVTFQLDAQIKNRTK